MCRKAAPCLPSWDIGVVIWDLSASVPVSCSISAHPGTQGKQGSGEAVSLPSVSREVFLSLAGLFGSSRLTFSREEQTWPLQLDPDLQITPCLCVFVHVQSP